jgi:hypothetical protein
MIGKLRVQILAGAALMLVSPVFLANHARTAAQDKDKHGSKEKIVVLAHLAIPGSPARQIFLQQEKGKQYLYLQQRVHFTVVDVTDPNNPKIIERAAGQGQLSGVGSAVAISVQSEQPNQDSVPTQTVRLVDVSDPKNPHAVKKFEGVTSIFSEDGRKLIYLTNGDGLWIVKHFEPYRLPMCTSDSEENSVAQCD